MYLVISGFMETISISKLKAPKLKAHVSAELKKFQRSVKLIVLDYNRPVAELVPTDMDALFIKEAGRDLIISALIKGTLHRKNGKLRFSGTFPFPDFLMQNI